MKKTVYDINPNPDAKWFKVSAIVECSSCKRSVNGYIILDRGDLKVVDTSGFMFFETIICDDCSEEPRTDFAKELKNAARELGLSLADLGIDEEKQEMMK